MFAFLMHRTCYSFDELVDMKRNSPKKLLYIYFAMQNYFEIMYKKQ